MNATIYIHKTNQAAWDALDNKSDWVNTLLKEMRASPAVTTLATALDDDSIEGQVAAAGFTFIEIDSDGQVHATKGDPTVDDNHYYFDVKHGKVIL